MADREKVIKKLSKYKKHAFGGKDKKVTVEEIIALLKAQEPVKPVFDAGDGKTIGQFLCGKCHAKIGFGHPHFCWYCGRAVKWE